MWWAVSLEMAACARVQHWTDTTLQASAAPMSAVVDAAKVMPLHCPVCYPRRSICMRCMRQPPVMLLQLLFVTLVPHLYLTGAP